ncbi:hypothetical protein AVEN_13328-1, partial [Araneus ventricosus]
MPCDATIPLCDDACRKFRPYPRDMRGRIKDRLSEYVGFYDSVFEKPDVWRVPNGVKLNARYGLGDDVYAIVQKYLQEDLTWYHIMLKHDGFETFVREMSKIRDKFVVLPY